jgi:hypothetical protein
MREEEFLCWALWKGLVSTAGLQLCPNSASEQVPLSPLHLKTEDPVYEILWVFNLKRRTMSKTSVTYIN